jgi:FtsP/CotA-like multicopper oxidase with cupredoxin domain
VFLRDGTLQPSRFYPLDAEAPPEGRPEPASGPDVRGDYRLRRAHWASYFPDRTLVAESGSRIRIRVHNRLSTPHAFAIAGVADTGAIAPNATVELELDAPAPGTYLYSDPTNGPVERLLGLFGALVVVPVDDPWRLDPGGTEFERQWLWLCQDVDPEWCRRAGAGETIDAERTPPVARYFMLNGRAGFQSLAATRDAESNRAAHEETLPVGYPRATDVRDFSKPDDAGSVTTGQLVRMVNAGVVVHQMHFHGNHVWTVRRNGNDFPRDATRARVDAEGHVVLQQWEDVVELDPLDRKEIVLPVRRPPETVDEVWAKRTEDWTYPMHCHAEPSQTAAGGLYPGGLVAHWVLAGREHVEHPTYRSQVEFALNQPKESNPVTEQLQRPDKTFYREFFDRRLRFPDRSEHKMWSFEDERSGRSFPAPLIRVTEGDLVHVRLKSKKNAHTIHLHGIEPDPRNDGVGHTSFEVGTRYTYQWRAEVGLPGDPTEGSAGSYFYHCHVNTVLHVQMGMVGPLIIDPVVHPDFPVAPGTRRAFVDGPAYDIDTELMLTPYAIDPRWHELSHAAGLSGEDVGLNRFRPRHFFVLGGSLAAGPPKDRVWAPTQVRARTADGGGAPTLLRVLNMNYFPTRVRFTSATGEPLRIAELISHDGRPFRDTSDPTGPSRPPRDLGNPLLTSALAFGSAERYDMLLHPPTAGTYLLHFDFYDWVVTGQQRLLATRTVPLVAS